MQCTWLAQLSHTSFIFIACWLCGSSNAVWAQEIERLPPVVDDLQHPLSPGPQWQEEVEPFLPDDFQAWWESRLEAPLAASGEPLPVTLETLIASAFQYSHQIRVFSDLPLIREQTIAEAEGEFDWRVFAETNYGQISDPVGNTLVTGGPDRFRESAWDFNGGMRQRNFLGGQFEIAQELGLTNNNSIFFVPNNQGTTRLRLSYNHPLLRGRGLQYNTAPIFLALLDAAAANDEFSRQLQAQMLEIARAYWALYVERATLIQRVRLVQETEELYQLLEQRRNLDVGLAQLLRAQSAVAERRSLLARSRNAVRNAESRIVSLVNDPQLSQVEDLELLPVAQAAADFRAVDMSDAKLTAIDRRPEIQQTQKQIEAAALRRDIACNDLQPYLNAVLETYVAGLRGNNDVGQSWVDQFSDGQPSYSAGLLFEYPLYNRTARARLRRREIELRQLQSQLQTTIETLLLEVEVAVREVQTSYDELQSKYLAMQATQKEVETIGQRWQAMAGNDPNAALYLDNLLTAQLRRSVAEREFTNALATYNLAQTNLARAQGTLLEEQHVEVARLCLDHLPQLQAARTQESPSNWEAVPRSNEQPLPEPTSRVPRLDWEPVRN